MLDIPPSGIILLFSSTFLSIDNLHLTPLSLGSPVLLSTFFHSSLFCNFFYAVQTSSVFLYINQARSSSASPQALPLPLYPALTFTGLALAGACDTLTDSQGTEDPNWRSNMLLVYSILARPKLQHFCTHRFFYISKAFASHLAFARGAFRRLCTPALWMPFYLVRLNGVLCPLAAGRLHIAAGFFS